MIDCRKARAEAHALLRQKLADPSRLDEWLTILCQPDDYPPSEVRHAWQNVEQLLLQAPGHRYPISPPHFRQTALGQLLARAARQTADGELVHIAEAARRTGVSRATVYSLINCGILHVIELGGGRSFLRLDELGIIEEFKSSAGRGLPSTPDGEQPSE